MNETYSLLKKENYPIFSLCLAMLGIGLSIIPIRVFTIISAICILLAFTLGMLSISFDFKKKSLIAISIISLILCGSNAIYILKFIFEI